MLRSPLKSLSIISDWKAWPTEVLYFPLTLYVFFVGLMRGKLFYFSAANPQIPLGGFAGDSKSYIIKHVPDRLRPKTVFIKKNVHSVFHILSRLEQKGITFPLIAKPDIGEGGFLVKLIQNEDELWHYHSSHDMAYILQEYIDLPIEVSVLFHLRHGSPTVSSFTQKEYLTIEGDGTSTVKELLSNNSRVRNRHGRLKQQLGGELERVLRSGEMYTPSTIGNLNCGTSFVNLANHIDDELLNTFKTINAEIGLFNYARYDIKCESIESLKRGEFYILEINGVKGEALHLYDEHINIRQAYEIIFHHWNTIFKISQKNIKEGFTCPGLREGFTLLFNHARTKRKALIPRRFV